MMKKKKQNKGRHDFNFNPVLPSNENSNYNIESIDSNRDIDKPSHRKLFIRNEVRDESSSEYF